MTCELYCLESCFEQSAQSHVQDRATHKLQDFYVLNVTRFKEKKFNSDKYAKLTSSLSKTKAKAKIISPEMFY